MVLRTGSVAMCMMASLYSPLWSMLCWRSSSAKLHISLPSVLQIRNTLPSDHSSHIPELSTLQLDSQSLFTHNPTMSRHPSTHPRRSMRPVENPLTEANLRLHSLACHQVSRMCPACFDIRTDIEFRLITTIDSIHPKGNHRLFH
jgi:hypothetical protein